MSALSMVARAASPTRAATSTKFRLSVATIFDSIPDTAGKSIRNSSADTELFARDNCEPRCNNGREKFYQFSSEERVVGMAAVIYKKGGPENFVWEKIEVGSPAHGQVRLRST